MRDDCQNNIAPQPNGAFWRAISTFRQERRQKRELERLVRQEVERELRRRAE